MHDVITFVTPYLNIYVKSYLIETEQYNVFIDSGLASNAENLLPYLKNGKRNVLLMTHGHWDHIGCNRLLHDHGAEIYAHPADYIFFEDFFWHWEYGFGQFETDMVVPPARREVFWREIGKPAPVDQFVKHGETLTFDDLSLQVIDLAGHSRGCIGFFDAESGALFTGDALMGEGFFGGMAQYCDFASYVASMNRIVERNPEITYTDHTDPLFSGGGKALATLSIRFAEQAKENVETFVRITSGEIKLSDAANFIASRAERKMGGGACVTALNHLNDLRASDERIARCTNRYICSM